MQQPPQAPVPPQYSSDGRFWWNGYQWVPVAGLPPQRTNPAFIVVPIVIVAVVLLIVAVGNIQGHQVNNVFSNITNGLGT